MRIRWGILCAMLLAGAFGILPAAGQGAAPADPLYAICARFGPPATRAELDALQGHELIGLSSDGRELFLEPLPDLGTGAADTMRFHGDGRQSAQRVTLDGREICIDGVDGPICTMPIHCLSDEAAMILIGPRDRALALIVPGLADTAPPPTPEGDGDGGFGQARRMLDLGADRAPLLSGPSPGPSPATALAGPDGAPCALGAGLALLDKAAFYRVARGQCRDGHAIAAEEVHLLSGAGAVTALSLRAGSGLAPDPEGRLRWSFPETPVPIEIRCTGAGDTPPAGPDQVTGAEVQLTLPPQIDLGHMRVILHLAAKARDQAVMTCARPVSALPVTVTLLIDRADRDAGGEEGRQDRVTVTLTEGREPRLSLSGARVLTRHRPDLAEVREASTRLFAQALRDALQARHHAALARKQDTGQIDNLADALQLAPEDTMQLLARGVTLTVPWHDPRRVDGQIVVIWRQLSTDPLDLFISQQSQHGQWDRFRAEVPPPPLPYGVQLTCEVDPAQAVTLPRGEDVPMLATLIWRDGARLRLSCAPP